MVCLLLAKSREYQLNLLVTGSLEEPSTRLSPRQLHFLRFVVCTVEF
jgi:hypothetical protein